jgi:hypothetical protein
MLSAEFNNLQLHPHITYDLILEAFPLFGVPFFVAKIRQTISLLYVIAAHI